MLSHHFKIPFCFREEQVISCCLFFIALCSPMVSGILMLGLSLVTSFQVTRLLHHPWLLGAAEAETDELFLWVLLLLCRTRRVVMELERTTFTSLHFSWHCHESRNAADPGKTLLGHVSEIDFAMERTQHFKQKLGFSRNCFSGWGKSGWTR